MHTIISPLKNCLAIFRTTKILKGFFSALVIVLLAVFVTANIFLDDTDTDWDAGTKHNMETFGTGADANISSSGNNVSGHFASQIFDAIHTANWTNITIRTEIPYGTEIGRAFNDNILVSDEIVSEFGFINTSGLILLMHFNNETSFGENATSGDGDLVYDFSVDVNSEKENRSNGTTHSGATINKNNYVFGGGSLELDGSNDYLDMSSGGILDTMSSESTWAVSFWAKSDSIGANTAAFSMRQGDNAASTLFLYYTHENNGGNGIRIWFSGTSIINENGITRTDGNFHHYMFVSRSATDHEAYVDGISVGTSTTSKTLPSALTGINLGRWYGTTQMWGGQIDEVSIWNRPLSADEILKLYKRGVLRLNLSVRSCDDSACDGDSYQQVSNLSFMGGKITNLSTGSGGLSTNRYFQYNLTYSRDITGTDGNHTIINNVSLEYSIPTMDITMDLNATTVTASSDVAVSGHISLSNGTNVTNTGINIFIDDGRLYLNYSKIETNGTGWELGTAINVTINANNITLNRNGSGQYPNQTGNFTSQVIDTLTGSNFTFISWTEEVPYQEEIGRVVGDNSDAADEDGFINTSGLILLMHFNNESVFGENATGGSADIVYDFSPDINTADNRDKEPHNNGTTANGATINKTNYKLGSGAGEFDGSDDVIDLSDLSSSIVDDITVMAWVQSNIATGQFRNVITEMFSGDGNVEFKLGLGGATNDKFVTGFYDGVWREAVDPIAPSTGVWYHLAGTYDGVTIRLYRDGVEVDTTAYSASLPSGTNGWKIGRRHDTAGGNHHWDGQIDEVAVWNRTLSADEILKLYKRGALSLNLSVRSCDDSSCSGEAWSEPLTNASGIVLNESITPINRYFQYKAVLSNYNRDLTGVSNANSTELNHTPVLYNVTINYTTLATDSFGDYNFTFVAPATAANYTIKVNTTFAGIDGQNSANLIVIAATSCACPSSGDWSITGTDNCSLTLACNLNGNDIYIASGASLDVDATIRNFNNIFVYGNLFCRANVCFG